MTNNTWFTYYNKDVYSADDVKSLDTMLSKGKVCVPFNVGWNSGCFFLGTGCSVFGPAGNDVSKGIDFGGDKAYTAAKKMLEVAANPNCVPGGMDTGLLMSGEVAAVFSGSWSRGELEKALGDKLGVAKLPTFEADGKTYNMTALSGSKAVGVNPTSGSVKGKQKICTELAAFMASEEMQLLRYEMRGVIPCHKNLANNEKIKADAVAVAEIETMNSCAVIQSALPEMSKYWSPVETFGKGCTNGDITMDNYMDKVDEMNEQLNQKGL
jgi:arabinogalactan oligomer/maltooligosaccharide transport system substrate-binding protein